jgi:hypothetical protein
MAIKGRRRFHKTSRSKRSRSKWTNRQKKRARCRTRRIHGGNYATDITSRETDGIPTKSLNKFTVAIPGQPAMSGTSYKRLAEAIDRDGHIDV